MSDYEEEIFVPPRPTMAPPPPPGTFIPPPPEFTCDLEDPDLRNLQPPPLPAPKPPSVFEEDFSFLKPPPMTPPKPPSICSSGSTSTLSASSLPLDLVPERPKFAAPQPPPERQPKAKVPPPKPVRLSSISTIDSPPATPAPPPPVQKPMASTFNPQNKAKLYDVPKTSILSRYEDCNPRPKQLLLLEDSGSVKSTPVLVQVDGKSPKLAPPPKPPPEERKKQDLDITPGSPSPVPELKRDIKSETAATDKPVQTQQTPPPQLQEVADTSVTSSEDQPWGPPSQTGKFSPLLDRKLRSLKGGESGAPRDAPAASPLTLLMAAKERDKQRSNQCWQGSALAKVTHPGANVHPDDLLSNGFAAKTRSGVPLVTSKSLTGGSSKPASSLEDLETSRTSAEPSPAPVEDQALSSRTNGTPEPSSAASLTSQHQTPGADHEDGQEVAGVPLLPPPPGFDDADRMMEPPPDLPPPDPPRNKPQMTPPSLKPKPPQPPKLPPLQAKPKPPVQTNLAKSPALPPSPLSPSQTTLLGILQKKMLEMDRKMGPAKEAEPSQDDWNTPLSDEDNGGTAVPKASPPGPSHKPPEVEKGAPDLKELEGKASTAR